MKGYADLHSMAEDERIKTICDTLRDAPKSSGDKPMMVAVIVDTRKVAKRYAAKLRREYSGIRIIDIIDGPVKGTVMLRVGEPLR